MSSAMLVTADARACATKGERGGGVKVEHVVEAEEREAVGMAATEGSDIPASIGTPTSAGGAVG